MAGSPVSMRTRALRTSLPALVFIVAVLLSAGASTARASGRHPSLSKLEGEIMCPTCHTTLDMSNSLEARRIEAFIRRRIAAGDSESEIKDKLVAQFGQAILAAPPDSGFGILAWWLPITAVLGGAAILGLSAWRWSRKPERAPGEAVPQRALPPELERLVDEELARF